MKTSIPLVAILAIIAIIASASACAPSMSISKQRASDSLNPLSDWHILSKGPLPDEDCECAFWANNKWVVRTDTNGAFVSPYLEDHSSALAQAFTLVPRELVSESAFSCNIQKCNYGWLVSFDAGEWGASLWWVSNNLSIRKRIGNDHVVGFLEMGNSTIMVTGFDHLYDYGGYVYIVEKDDSKGIKQKQIARIESKPEALYLENNQSLLIATKHQLLRVLYNGSVSVVHDFSCVIIPTSIASDNEGGFYIGTSNYILHIAQEEHKYAEYWYLPPECARVKMITINKGYITFECECSK